MIRNMYVKLLLINVDADLQKIEIHLYHTHSLNNTLRIQHIFTKKSIVPANTKKSH